MKQLGLLFFLPLCFALGAPLSLAGDREDLAQLLNDFLAGADQKVQHQRLWSDDLVYTSSNGTRFGKAEILAGFEEPAEPSATRYRGEDVDIRLYGDTAVVAFKLVGENADDGSSLHFLNTGTFLKRDGQWRAVAWQATKVPVEPAR